MSATVISRVAIGKWLVEADHCVPSSSPTEGVCCLFDDPRHEALSMGAIALVAL